MISNEETNDKLTETIDQLSINQPYSSADTALDKKTEITDLKNKMTKQEEAINTLKSNMSQLEQANLELLQENDVYKFQLEEMNLALKDILPKKSATLDVKNYKKYSSFQFDEDIRGILELSDGTIPCWTAQSVKLLKLNADKLGISHNFAFTSEKSALPIQQNGFIIFRTSLYLMTVCDQHFNLIQTFNESSCIISIYNVSHNSFAVSTFNKIFKIYTINSRFQRYELLHEFKSHSDFFSSLLYLPERNYILSGEFECIEVLSLPEGKSIKKLSAKSFVTSLIYYSREIFASASKGEIKIWNITGKLDIRCIKTLNAHENSNSIYLYLMGNFMVSQSAETFKFWDINTFECLQTHIEDSYINLFIVSKCNNIITALEDKKVNIWKI